MCTAVLNWGDVARGVAALVQIVAIVVGGGWAYYKFIRGRTFKPRAEIDLDASLVEADGHRALSVTVAFRNVGLIYIPFIPPPPTEPIRMVSIWTAVASQEVGAGLVWEASSPPLVEIFKDYRGCEVGERVTDHVLVPVPAGPVPALGPWLAYRVSATIVSPTRTGPRGGRNPWSATMVVTDALQERVDGGPSGGDR
jgi:hypothetical protein